VPPTAHPVRWRAAARLVAALALAATAACGADQAADRPDDEVPPSPAPREPAEVGEGCGRPSRTDPADLNAARVVARCGAGAPAARPLPDTTPLRMAVPEHPTEEEAPVLLADSLGEFAAERLEVELVEMDVAEAVPALVDGEVDVVVGRFDAAIFDAVNRGVRARIVLGGALTRSPDDLDTPQPGLWVRSDAIDEDDKDWRDLEDQPMGVPGGYASAVTVPIEAVFGLEGISINEVAVTDLASDEAAQRLAERELVGAWLDGTSWLPIAEASGFELLGTPPATEPITGSMASGRLLDRDRAVGLAYARAVIRTINTHLSGDYRSDDEVMAALAEALGASEGELADTPAPLFDWELRAGTTSRIEEQLIELGGVDYDVPMAPERVVDRTLATEAVRADE
jgi:NitT/TauT family transport system substrate-binding protein